MSIRIINTNPPADQKLAGQMDQSISTSLTVLINSYNVLNRLIYSNANYTSDQALTVFANNTELQMTASDIINVIEILKGAANAIQAGVIVDGDDEANFTLPSSSSSSSSSNSSSSSSSSHSISSSSSLSSSSSSSSSSS